MVAKSWNAGTLTFANPHLGQPARRRRRGVTEGVWRRCLWWHSLFTCLKNEEVSVPAFQPRGDLGGSGWKPAQTHFQVVNFRPECAIIPPIHVISPMTAMGLRFKTESHGGQRDSSLRERGLLLWGGNGTPFAVNRDSFCRQSGLLLPCNVTPFAVIWDSSPPTLLPCIRQQDNKKTSV